METLFAFGILLLFVCGWMSICWLLARMGGWHSLARVYRTSREPPQHMHNFCAATLNWFANYNGVLRIGFLPEGLYMVPFSLFRFGHPPLLIPWSDIQEADDSSSFFKRFSIGRPEIATIAVPGRMTEKIRAEIRSKR